jgi:hypothetical protein
MSAHRVQRQPTFFTGGIFQLPSRIERSLSSARLMLSSGAQNRIVDLSQCTPTGGCRRQPAGFDVKRTLRIAALAIAVGRKACLQLSPREGTVSERRPAFRCEPEIKPHGNTRQTFGRAIRSALWRYAVHGETDQWARFLRLPSRRVCVDIESNVAEAEQMAVYLASTNLMSRLKLPCVPSKTNGNL